MNRKTSILVIAAAMALVSVGPALAAHPLGAGQHPNFPPTDDEGAPCSGATDRTQANHISYATGGVVVRSTDPLGTTRNTGGSATQIHDECQDDSPLYMGDNEYEWGVNGGFLWTSDDGTPGAPGDLNHNAGPNARRASPANGAGWPNPHHAVGVIPAVGCGVTIGTPNTLTGCTWAASAAGTDACVEDLDALTVGAAFTIGADIDGNGVISSGYPQLEPTVVGLDPAAAGPTCDSPRQVAVLDPATGLTTVLLGGTTDGEGPGYDDGTSDTDRNPTAESGLPCNVADSNPANDCARNNGAGNEHGFWVFIRSTLVVSQNTQALYSSTYTRITG